MSYRFELPSDHDASSGATVTACASVRGCAGSGSASASASAVVSTGATGSAYHRSEGSASTTATGSADVAGSVCAVAAYATTRSTTSTAYEFGQLICRDACASVATKPASSA